MRKEKTYNLIGFIIGIVMSVVGLITVFTPADTYSTQSAEHCVFGADFYTEEYAATRAAVSNTAVTANNIRELGEKIAQYCGLSFVFAGCLVSLSYAKKLFCVSADKEEKQENISSEILIDTQSEE